MDAAPPWLADEPELHELLTKVLDRFDQQPGEERRQRLYFAAEQHLPPLKRLDAEADQLWRFVLELQRRGVLTVDAGRRGPYDAAWEGARLAFLPDCEGILRTWFGRPPEEPAIRVWRAAVQELAAAFQGGIDALLKRRITVTGFSDREVVEAFARIGVITESLTLRQLSALLFRGDSKRLDGREELVRALFPEFPIKPRPLVIAIHLPNPWRGVLFIENQDTYAAAVAGEYPDAHELALVYGAGFRGGAERIRQPGSALLHYSGEGNHAEFEAWWLDRRPAPGPLHFFGDLDFAGMSILASLRQRFGEVDAWEPGYASLLEQLQDGLGHSPDAASKEQQCDPGRTGCSHADNTLLPAMRQMGFIDQETPAVR